ncbi:hypothetical protein SDC9_191287 [bioreactor metagenome]|uniref:Uncharacterized protein n=1 Tax=bioreactor metagenome TaxID=1076179 RepID=A0A645HXK8_9ZZZZ
MLFQQLLLLLEVRLWQGLDRHFRQRAEGIERDAAQQQAFPGAECLEAGQRVDDGKGVGGKVGCDQNTAEHV